MTNIKIMFIPSVRLDSTSYSEYFIPGTPLIYGLLTQLFLVKWDGKVEANALPFSK